MLDTKSLSDLDYKRKYYCSKCNVDLSCDTDKETEYIRGARPGEKFVVVEKCPKCGGQIKPGFPKSYVGICANGDFDLVSDSLAVTPQQVAEHRKTFPDIDVQSDGRLHFTDVRKYDKYLKQTGFKRQSHGKITGP
jgi:hypothetical protein